MILSELNTLQLIHHPLIFLISRLRLKMRFERLILCSGVLSRALVMVFLSSDMDMLLNL